MNQFVDRRRLLALGAALTGTQALAACATAAPALAPLGPKLDAYAGPAPSPP